MTGSTERDPDASAVLDARTADAALEATRRSAYLDAGLGRPWWWSLTYSLLFGGLVAANTTQNPVIMLPGLAVFGGGAALLVRWRARRFGVLSAKWRGMPREVKSAHMPVALFGGLAGVFMLATWSDRFDPPALLVGAIGAVAFFAGLLWSNALFRRTADHASASSGDPR